MMKSCRSLACALQLLLSTSAFAQDAPLTECDTYAASDMDPPRKTVGIAFDKVNPKLAIPACEAAVREYPTSNRLAFQLGRAYQKANNFESAVAQYRKAADQGLSLAQNNLGSMYYNGQGVLQDFTQALAWYRKAADQGLSLAQYNLGKMYIRGEGVPKDSVEGQKWYRLAADKGFALAQAALGVMYYKGEGVSQDFTHALAWSRKAAEQGQAEAQTILALLYYKGEGVSQDFTQALAWSRKAAEQGQAAAQTIVGVMYYNGEGVVQDFTQALAWFRKAADQGHARARSYMAQEKPQPQKTPPPLRYSQAFLPNCNDPEVVQIVKKLASTRITGSINSAFVDMITVDQTQGMGINNNSVSKYCRALFRCDMNVAREAERGVYGEHPLQAACYRLNQAADSGDPAWIQFELGPDGSGGLLAKITDSNY